MNHVRDSNGVCTRCGACLDEFCCPETVKPCRRDWPTSPDESLVAQLARLVAEVERIHRPEDQEVEVYQDAADWGAEHHDEWFPDCPGGSDCEGHERRIKVCRECGYDHEGELPIYREWPCPTWKAAHPS